MGNKTIQQLLVEVGEDKCDNLATTSYKFKTDLWNFCKDKSFTTAVEFGTHKGQTTRILAHLFDKVYTVNINDNKSGKEFNKDLDNIVFVDNFNLYGTKDLGINDPIDLFLIDAGHDYNQVVLDLNRAFEMNCKEDCYIVFDDYGLRQFEKHVKRAVDQAVFLGAIEIIQGIGHEAGHSFGGTPPRVLSDREGVIAKVKYHG